MNHFLSFFKASIAATALLLAFSFCTPNKSGHLTIKEPWSDGMVLQQNATADERRSLLLRTDAERESGRADWHNKYGKRWFDSGKLASEGDSGGVRFRAAGRGKHSGKFRMGQALCPV